MQGPDAVLERNGGGGVSIRRRWTRRGISYSYDAFGRLAAVEEDESLHEFKHDVSGSVTNECLYAAGRPPVLAARLDRAFDALHRPSALTLEIDGDFAQETCYDYGMDGKLSGMSLADASGASFSVSFDWEQGRFVGWTVSDAAGTPVFSRTQTRARRRPALVTSVTNAGAAVRGFAYAYDHIGNRTASSDLFGATAYTANALNQYVSLGSRDPSLVHDAIQKNGRYVTPPPLGGDFFIKWEDGMEEGFDIRYDGGFTPLSAFGNKRKEQNFFGCYITDQVRKRSTWDGPGL